VAYANAPANRKPLIVLVTHCPKLLALQIFNLKTKNFTQVHGLPSNPEHFSTQNLSSIHTQKSKHRTEVRVSTQTIKHQNVSPAFTLKNYSNKGK